MCHKAAASELAARVTGIMYIQRPVCDLIMSQSAFLEECVLYQALYRKYRPQTFDDVVGQRSVTDTLKSQLSTGRLSHAYLFTGTRGTGKTSCAKILAKAVNCEDLRDGNPCNVCPACRAIDAGGCMDVLEIDAASNNGVDNVRTLRDEAVYTPSELRRRVYIIDEVHMLSTAAFNALLKIIEEPPPHLIFILATTESHKIPATILSRCQRFSFRRLTPEDVEGRLMEVAAREDIALEPEAARLLARLADGALRDGLSLLDQCASAGGTLTGDLVYERLGLAGSRQTAALMSAIAAQDAAEAVGIFSRLYAQGKDVAAMLSELCALSRDLLILKTAPKSGAAMLSGVGSGKEAGQLLGRFSAGELLRVTSLLQKTASGFSQSADKRLDAELCLLELCSPALRQDIASLNARISRLETALASGSFVAAAAPTPVSAGDGEPEAGTPAEEREETAEAVCETLPAGFWVDLMSDVSPELLPGDRSVLPQTVPVLRGDVLELQADSEFSQGIINREPVLEPLRRCAAARLKRKVALKVTVQGGAGGDILQKLIHNGEPLGDRLQVKHNDE